ncbi:DUF5906 domain-containing protein [Candidatus Gracilibacteria bacterium]|nr:DUF5906 domain-containing protein [Candidatus Gracilibacteria bacterium]
MENNPLTQKEFISLFPDTRHRYIHDVKKIVVQGNNVLDMSWNKKGYGVFYSVNGFPPNGKATQLELLSLNCNYVDFDVDGTLSQEDISAKIQEIRMLGIEGDVPLPTVIIRTQKGAHLIWLYQNNIEPTEANIEQWRDVQKRLVNFFKGDVNAIDPARVLRLPDTLHLKNPSKPFEVKVMAYNKEERITLDELDKILPKHIDTKESSSKVPVSELLVKGVSIGKGERHSKLIQVAGLFLQEADTKEKVEIARSNYYDWDQKIVGSPERFSERKKELDDVFSWVLKKKKSNAKELSSKIEYIRSFYETNTVKSRNVGGYILAEFLVKKYNVKTIGEKIREIYVYENGVYRPGENILREEIQSILKELVNSGSKSEIIDKIKDLTLIDREEFNKVNIDLINLNNGVLNIRNLELTPHDPSYLFFSKLPVDYKLGGGCPTIKKFLSEILSEKDIVIIQEWVGYCLYRKYFIKKAIIFVGEPDTGKTTLINLFVHLFGRDNISGVSLQRISGDKFSVAHLYNKYINIYDDLSFSDVNDNGSFKIVTGGGNLTGEYKFGNQFHFENFSKITFSCNKIPNVSDTNDEAYFSRWIVMQFNRQIAVKNKFLIYEMTTPEEISGFLNFALEGLSRLLKNQDFSYNKIADEIKNEMLRSGSPIANFAYDCLVDSNDSWLSKEVMYNSYADFVKTKNLPLIPMIDFGRKITKFANYVVDSKKGGKTGWRNVKLKNAVEDDPFDDVFLDDSSSEIIDITDDFNL